MIFCHVLNALSKPKECLFLSLRRNLSIISIYKIPFNFIEQLGEGMITFCSGFILAKSYKCSTSPEKSPRFLPWYASIFLLTVTSGNLWCDWHEKSKPSSMPSSTVKGKQDPEAFYWSPEQNKEHKNTQHPPSLSSTTNQQHQNRTCEYLMSLVVTSSVGLYLEALHGLPPETGDNDGKFWDVGSLCTHNQPGE